MTLTKPQTLEEAWVIIQAQAVQIEELQKQIELLKKEIEEIKKNTKRSPPSFAKPNTESKGGQRGPPFGHSFFSRRDLEVTEEKEWTLTECPRCGLPVSAPVEMTERLEIDLPPVKPIVRRHKIGRHWCRRCKRLVSPQVRGLLAHTPYGINLHLQVAHLKYGLGLTMEKIASLFREFYGLSLSSGVISEMVNRLGGAMQPVHTWLKEALLLQEVLNADETGWRVTGINHWLWTFCSAVLVYYHIDRSRGRKVVQEVLGERFDGVLVTDFYSAYHQIGAAKQKCWVHVLRDIKKIEEIYPQEKRLLIFTQELKRQLRCAISIKESWKDLEDEVYRKRAKRVEIRLEGLLHYAPNYPLLKTLVKRLIYRRRELFTFLERKEVPYHNNDAERQIRPCVLMRKTSYQNASQRGASTQAILMSVIQTCRKKSINFFVWGRRYLKTFTATGPPYDPFASLLTLKPVT